MHGRHNFVAKILIFNYEDGYSLGTIGSLNIQSDLIPADEDVSDGRASQVWQPDHLIGYAFCPRLRLRSAWFQFSRRDENL
jgi:hypothetical protein